MSRIDIDTYMMRVAYDVAQRSTCPRASVGAVVARRANIVSAGYNGSPSKTPHCEDKNVGCILDSHGKCIRTIHAEVNALLKPTEIGHRGSTLYVTHLPCVHCCHIIINLRILRVVYSLFYLDPKILQFGFKNQVEYLLNSNILVDHLVTQERKDVDPYNFTLKNP